MRKAVSIMLNSIAVFIVALAIVITLANLGILSQGSEYMSSGR
jgi:hypothetical protein